MSWIIVSVPFWLIGGVLSSLGAAGAFFYLRNEFRKPGSGDTQLLWGGMVLLLAGGIALAIAAKVAS